ARLFDFVGPTPHYLESWGDVQFTKNRFSLMQPTIRPLFDTRQFQDTLLRWTDNSQSYYNYLKETWSGAGISWNEALHDGSFEASAPAGTTSTQTPETTTGAASNTRMAALEGEGDFELELYTSVALGDGQQANNPWLQEFPDPSTRASWDNYLNISRVDAEALGHENRHTSNGALNGSYVNLKVGDTVLENVPVYIQPGQARGSVSLALGY